MKQTAGVMSPSVMQESAFRPTGTLMPNQHKNPMLACHPDDGTLVEWVKAEAERRGVPRKVIIEEALSEKRQREQGGNE